MMSEQGEALQCRYETWKKTWEKVEIVSSEREHSLRHEIYDCAHDNRLLSQEGQAMFCNLCTEATRAKHLGIEVVESNASVFERWQVLKGGKT